MQNQELDDPGEDISEILADESSNESSLGVRRDVSFKPSTWSEDVDVSKNRGAPKWMVYNGKPY